MQGNKEKRLDYWGVQSEHEFRGESIGWLLCSEWWAGGEEAGAFLGWRWGCNWGEAEPVVQDKGAGPGSGEIGGTQGGGAGQRWLSAACLLLMTAHKTQCSLLHSFRSIM